MILTARPADLRTALARQLRGEAVPWESWGRSSAELLEACNEEDLTGLVCHAARGPLSTDWPGEVRRLFDRAAAALAAEELLRQRELKQVLNVLAPLGIHPILLKGTALAYSIYPSPDQRPRKDTDMLIRHEEVDRLRPALRQAGYVEPVYCDGELLFCQFEMQKLDQFGFCHALDFHWKISTQALFANLLSYDEMSAVATPLPSLGPHARGPGLLHSLLLACVHPVMHHRGVERLLWVYDVHLLASRLPAADWDPFVRLARGRRVSAICHTQLLLARNRFGTRVPQEVLEALGSGSGDEPSVAYLATGRRWHDEVGSNLRALRTWRERLQLLCEIALPSAGYMMKSYHLPDRALTRVLLPLLYAHRGIKGAMKVVTGRK